MACQCLLAGNQENGVSNSCLLSSSPLLLERDSWKVFFQITSDLTKAKGEWCRFACGGVYNGKLRESILKGSGQCICLLF